jgi:hypothetical protein
MSDCSLNGTGIFFPRWRSRRERDIALVLWRFVFAADGGGHGCSALRLDWASIVDGEQCPIILVMVQESFSLPAQLVANGHCLLTFLVKT